MRLISEYISNNGGTFRSAAKASFVLITKSDFVHKVGQTFTLRVFLIGTGIITSVLIARILGPEGRGLYAVAMTIGVIGVQLGNLGLPVSNTYYVAGEPRLLPGLVDNSLKVSFVFGGFLSFFVWIIFSICPELAPIRSPLLALSLLWIPFGLAYLLLQHLLLGINEVRAYNKIELVNQLAGIIFLGFIIFSHAVRVETVFFAAFFSLVASFFLALMTVKNRTKYFSSSTTGSYAQPKLNDHISYALKAYFASLFSFLVLRLDLLMIKYLLGDEQTGYYSVAVTISNMLFLFPSTVGMLLFPKLTGTKSARDKWKMTYMTAIFTGMIMTAMCILIYLFGKTLIILLFGIKFEPAYKPLIFIVFGILAWSFEFLFRLFLNSDRSTGYRKEIVIIWFVVCVLNIILNALFIPRYGIVGSAIASCVSFVLVGMMVAILVIREYKELSKIDLGVRA